MQVTGLMERCATMLQRGLAVGYVIQMAVLADRIKHAKLYKSCVTFASLEENSYTFLFTINARRGTKSARRAASKRASDAVFYERNYAFY